MKTRSGKFYLVSAIILAFALLVSDISLFYTRVIGEFGIFETLREVFNVLTLTAVYFYIGKSTPLADNINDAVKSIVQSFTGIAVLYLVSALISLSHTFDIDSSFHRNSITTIISTSVLSHGAMFFFVRIIHYMRVLIFYKRRKHTALFYQAFKAVVFAAGIITVIYGERRVIGDSNLNFDLPSLLYIVFILICVVLFFRNSWVTYLKRKEKYYFLLGTIALTGFYLLIISELAMGGDEYENILAHSMFYGTVTSYVFLFIQIYTVVAAVNIILHLPTARVFDRKMKEVRFLHNLSTAINSEPDFNKLVLMITNMANEVTEAKATWLEIYDPKNNNLYIASSKNLSSIEIKTASLSINEGLSGRVFHDKQTIVIHNVEKSTEFRYLKYWKKDVSTVVAVPLITTKNNILGIIYAGKEFEFAFDPDDVAMLEAFSNQVVIALENAKLIKESIQRERLEQELKIAREVQQKLLPQDIPEIDGIEMDAIAFTANEVGGDYYDFILYNDHCFSAIIADVSGKGTSAAFYMAELKGIVKSLSTIYSSPKELMVHANDVLNKHLEKKSFITASMISFDVKEKKIKHVRAGHCPLIKYSAHTHSVEYLTPKGLGLGLAASQLFGAVTEEQDIDVSEGDILILYTDGLNEARNIFEDEYGDEKIGDIVLKNYHKSAMEIKNAILDDVILFAGKAKMHDDMTLTVIKVCK